MPLPLPPTPWLNPPNYAESFATGMGIGQRAAQAKASTAADIYKANLDYAAAQQRIAAQQSQAQLEAQVQQDVANQRALVEGQRAATEAAYREAQLGLEGQKLAQVKKMDDLKIQQDAKRAATILKAQEMKKAGMKDEDIWLQLGLELGGEGLAGIAALIRAKQVASQPTKEDLVMKRMPAETLKSSILQMEKDYAAMQEGRAKTEFKARMDERKRYFNKMFPGEDVQLPFPEVELKKIQITRDPKTGKLIVVQSESTETATPKIQGPPEYAGPASMIPQLPPSDVGPSPMETEISFPHIRPLTQDLFPAPAGY